MACFWIELLAARATDQKRIVASAGHAGAFVISRISVQVTSNYHSYTYIYIWICMLRDWPHSTWFLILTISISSCQRGISSIWKDCINTVLLGGFKYNLLHKDPPDIWPLGNLRKKNTFFSHQILPLFIYLARMLVQ